VSELADLAESLYPVSKASRDDSRRRKNIAVGAGGGSIALGLAGGGIPGMHADRIAVDMERAKGVKQKVRTGGRVFRAGIFGGRHNAHDTAMKFTDEMNPNSHAGRGKYKLFRRAGVQGVRGAEKQVLGHLRIGQHGSNALLIGGAGAVAYGATRRNKKVEKADRRDVREAVGGLGAGTAVGSLGIGTVLNRQGKKWLSEAERDYAEAQHLTPRMGGSKTTHTKLGSPKTVRAEMKLKDVTPRMLRGVSRADAARAGALRGRAGQAAYFGRQYKLNANALRRYVAPAGVAAAAWGLSDRGRKKKRSR
jgi:hypothetical protein